MNLPEKLPCKCTNPSCGLVFESLNPISGGGANFVFSNNKTYCPRCNSEAMYSDWKTDSQGNFHLKGFLSELREINDVSILENIKQDLEAANDSITAQELAETLAEIEPRFEKFISLISRIPTGQIVTFVALLVSIISVCIAYNSLEASDRHHEENLELQREQHDLAKEQFEYQKERDKINDAREREELRQKLEELERAIEKSVSANEADIQKESVSKLKSIKGKLRNKPCPCGSGKKAKKCHPYGVTGKHI